MILDAVHILPTDKSPEVFLDPEGTIKIKGRGLIVNRSEVTDRIMDWIDQYLENPADVTYVSIAFEYLNSFSATTLVSVIRRINQVLLQSKRLKIQWYYEDDDEDIYERGEYIAAALNIPIEFIVTHKIADN